MNHQMSRWCVHTIPHLLFSFHCILRKEVESASYLQKFWLWKKIQCIRIKSYCDLDHIRSQCHSFLHGHSKSLLYADCWNIDKWSKFRFKLCNQFFMTSHESNNDIFSILFCFHCCYCLWNMFFGSVYLLQAPAAFGLVSFLLHEGFDRPRIRKHLLAFAVAAPLLSVITYMGLSQVSV